MSGGRGSQGRDAALGRQDSGESLPEPPPLNLGLQGADDPPADEPMDDDGSGGRHHWRWWLALGVALVVGAMAGAIGANARNDAIERNRIDLVATGIAPSYEAGVNGDEAQLEISLLNLGVLPVEVVEVDIAGLQLLDGGTPIEATTLEPRGLGRVRVWFEIECDGAAAVESLDVSVLTSSAERTVTVDVPAEAAAVDPWRWGCGSPGIEIAEMNVAPRVPGTEHLSVSLGVRVPPDYAMGRFAIHVRANARGFEVAAVDAPLELRPGEVTQLELDWTVASCAEAESFDGLSFEMFVSNDLEGSSVHAEQIWVDDVLVHLVALLAEVCGS